MVRCHQNYFYHGIFQGTPYQSFGINYFPRFKSKWKKLSGIVKIPFTEADCLFKIVKEHIQVEQYCSKAFHRFVRSGN